MADKSQCHCTEMASNDSEMGFITSQEIEICILIYTRLSISVPTQERTLSDYRCYKPLSSGVDTPYIFEVAAKFGKQNVTILVDEMKVSAGLTYSVSTGELCGYVDSLDADTLLDVSQSTSSPDTASHALCFMARGLKSNLQAVVATYATHCLNAEQLYNRFWHVVSRCELAGLRVRCCVSDGASINRKYIKQIGRAHV